MLQREAEQATEDLVVRATDRSEEYARGLTSVAELASRKKHLKRKIPVMNAFAATESNLAHRIRRTLGGGTQRMDSRSRVLAAILCCALCAVTLPSSGNAQDRDAPTTDAQSTDTRTTDDGVDWETARTTPPEDWSQELKGQIISAGYDLEQIAKRVRLGQQDQDAERDHEGGDELDEFREGVIARALATVPEEWSDTLQAAIVRAGWDVEELAEGIRLRQEAGQHEDGDDPDDAAAALEKIGAELRAAVERGEITAEEARARWVAASQHLDQSRETAELDAIGLRIRRAVVNGTLTAEEGRERMEQARARLAEADTDQDRLDEFRREVAERAMATAPEEWSDELKGLIERAGWDLHEFTKGVRMRQQLAAVGREIRAAVERGEITAEQGRERMEVAHRDLQTRQDDANRKLREFQQGVVERALATSPEEWSDELKALIVRAGWDPGAVAERVRRAQAADGETLELADLRDETDTAVQARSWGQVKVEVADPE